MDFLIENTVEKMEIKTMEKGSYCFYLIKEDYDTFEEVCKKQLSSPSREVNLFMRAFVKQHNKKEGKRHD